MKLNNKGFAVSTILYGILSLTIIILMLIFGMMKSSKDLNQELVTNIEEDVNECVTSEVELEACYFSGGECDPSEYNSCIGKKDEDVKLANVAKIGDYVNYDAGTWTTTASTPSSTSAFTFGGYTAGTSRNNSSSCTPSLGYDGWRILSIEGDTVKLIHAGIPECMYVSFSNRYPNRINNYLNIITGSSSGAIDTSFPSTPKDWSIYVNNNYATNAYLFNLEELNHWYSQVNHATMNYGETFDDDLIHIEGIYLLSDIDSWYSYYMLNYPIYSSVYNATSGLYGIRPVVVLKEGIKTSGSITNTDGNQEWILVR